MEGASRTAGVVPTIGAATTQLVLVNDTFGPRSMPLVAVLAWLSSRNARHVCKQSLDIATAIHVELLLMASLGCFAYSSLAGKSLAESTISVDRSTEPPKSNFHRGKTWLRSGLGLGCIIVSSCLLVGQRG
jgi:hypothetical protein